ncbi:unnamed protein product [Scytosiphon promiscuus]
MVDGVGSSSKMSSLDITNAESERKGVGEVKATAPTPLEIREYSEESFRENDDTSNDRQADLAAGKKESITTSTSESLEESRDRHTPRTAADEEYERDAAQQKLNRRARAQPGAKRGGRRDTGRGAGRRWGRRKNHFEDGDLVEAEWKESGWWYVGYVGVMPSNGGESKDDTTIARESARGVKNGKNRKGVFHVVFADGDEADVLGKNLKPLTTKGTTREDDPTALPGHVPVVDVGSGRLHGGLEAPSHKNQAAGGDALRRGSAGNVQDRRRQGNRALWGGRGARNGSPTTAGRSGVGLPPEEDGEWWETGTRYAFQPRLAADMPTVSSFVNRGRRHGGAVNGDQRSGSPPQTRGGGGSGGNDGGGGIGGANQDGRTGPTTTGAAPTLPVQQRGRLRSPVNVAPKASGRELIRIIKAPEGNDNHGQRVFFLA